MYCPECGKSNPEGLQNCQYCNAELKESVEESSPASVVAQKLEGVFNSVKKIDLSKGGEFVKKHKAIVIAIVCVVAIITALCSIVSFAVSPKRTAEKYLNALISGDTKTLFECVALPSGKFITEEGFVKQMESYKKELFGNSQMSEFAIEEYDSKLLSLEGEFLKVYNVKFFSPTNGETLDQTLVLTKQNEKELLFFPKYKAIVESVVCNDLLLTVYAPQNSHIEIDGIALEQSDIVESVENSDVTYRIDAIFCGEHKVAITGEITEPVEYDMYVYSNSTEESVGAFKSYNLNETAKEFLIKRAAEDMQKLFDSAIANKPVSETGIIFADNTDDISWAYKNICDYVHRDKGEGLESIVFSDCTSKYDYIELDSDGKSTVYLNYSYTFVKSVIQNEALVKKTSERAFSSSTNLTYVLDEGNWQLEDISYYHPSYY